ncbi:hypothetical protein RRF57_004232 [Xylaria bambusicola]|uniref:Uncharacterized protein n=1 Tax=Xylaria bambusicola TaxID=326684 RepID=A0AAN7Z3N1_9PEZI
MRAYEPRLDTFLRLLENEEKKMQTGSELTVNLENLSLSGNKSIALSQRMRRSWETKAWVINYAAKASWEFDGLF